MGVRWEKVRDWWPLVAVGVVLVAAFWVLYVVWRSPHRSDLATYGAFAVAVITLVAGPIAWAHRRRTSQPGSAAASQNPDHVAGLMAMAVEKQWKQAAGERGLIGIGPIPIAWGKPSLPLAGPVAAAAASQQFTPLPGLAPTREKQLARGRVVDLHAIYGGLTSGRLVIAGAPGSGKSGAAVLLVLAALKHRAELPAEDRTQVPVPVLFTAQNWDPRRQPVREWLIERLQETYALFAGQTGAANAAGLIDAGKIALIFDGLDEIAEELRPAALHALSQQANFRLVVLSRTAEMASTAASRHGVLQGAAAIELRAITPAVAADYLKRVQRDPPPDGWRDLIDRIRTSQGSPLANALNSPLALTLIRDTYQSADDARELLDFCDNIQQHVSGEQAVEDITDHLLDRVLPVAYAHQPGQPPPRYDHKIATNGLERIAARMKQDGTRDLQWWRIPDWAPSAPRAIVVGLLTALVIGFMFGLTGDLVYGLVGVLVGVLACGLGTAVVTVSLVLSRSNNPPKRIAKPRLRRALKRRTLTGGLAGVLVGAIGFGAGIGSGSEFRTGLIFGLLGALAGGLVGVLWTGLNEALTDPDSTNSASPTASWHSDRRYAVMLASIAGLVGVLVGWLTTVHAREIAITFMFSLTVGLTTMLLVVLSASRFGTSSLAAVHLAKRWHTPVHLMDFLDDAHQRNVLRTVGPVYQFRHARLQDRLAAANAISVKTTT